MEIKLVEYDNSYAKAVAEMWQKSKEGWNGESFMETEDEVKTFENNSSYIVIWLAMDGDEVVGYLKLQLIDGEKNKGYVALLNVRYDYHGKKVGKLLMLASVNKSIELGWDQLTLHTWAGNTKAIPLYKKCGFLWEDRDNTTHLANYISVLHKDELLKDYFNEIDWYKDTTRNLEIVVDGKKEDNFEYMPYSWKKNDTNLLVEFTRYGEGLRKINTDDFSITSSIENRKLVFGQTYNINYEIENKSGKKLDIVIKGKNNKNIKFDFISEKSIEDKDLIQGEFFIEPINKELKNWKEDPCVVSEIFINGKKTIFKTGIDPQYPADMGVDIKSQISYPGFDKEGYLNIENCFNSETTFKIKLKDTPDIKFKEKNLEVTLNGKESDAILINFKVLKGNVFCQNVEVEAIKKGSKPINFTKEISFISLTRNDIFTGETSNQSFAANGDYLLKYNRKESKNEMSFTNVISGSDINFNTPMFDSELLQNVPGKIELKIIDNYAQMIISMLSDKTEGLKFKTFYNLYSNGFIEKWFEFQYTGNKALNDNITFKDFFRIYFQDTVMPVNGYFIEHDNVIGNDSQLWTNATFDENWIFNKKPEGNVSVCWPESGLIECSSWGNTIFNIPLNVDELNNGKLIKTDKYFFVLDYFSDWKSTREFSIGKQLEEKTTIPSLEIKANKGNPFISKNIDISIIEHKSSKMKCCLKVSSANNSLEKLVSNFEIGTDSKDKFISVDYINTGKIDDISLDLNYGHYNFQKHIKVFPVSNIQIKNDIETVNRNKIKVVDNGIIKIKASEDFAPVLYSMQHKGEEWLECSFPKPSIKSWWNPWLGGIYYKKGDIHENALMKEKFAIDFIEMKDNYDNEWSGLKIEQKFKETESVKGITVSQYFMLLPNSPVLYSVKKIIQNSGKNKDDISFENLHFLNTSDDLHKCRYNVNRNGKEITQIGGEKQSDLDSEYIISFENKTKEGILNLVSLSTKKDFYGYFDTSTAAVFQESRFDIKNGETKWLHPDAYIFSNEKLTKEEVSQLNTIKFPGME